MSAKAGHGTCVGLCAWELLKRGAKEDKPLARAVRSIVELHLGEAELLRAGPLTKAPEQ
jgi:hypothetical protein